MLLLNQSTHLLEMWQTTPPPPPHEFFSPLQENKKRSEAKVKVKGEKKYIKLRQSLSITF